MGTITTWSCAAPGNGFTLTKQYILGPSGEQMTEVDYRGGSATWAHTNAYAGDVVATYLNDGQGPHYRLADWLGTTRVQVNSAGVAELTCASLPFGDPQVPCTSPPATEQFFTGKERDAESGNDYFGARYYASTMGRFMSPDPMGNSVADFSNPQSWNMYAYVLNNPLKYVDPTGLDCAYLNDTGDGIESTGSGGYWVSGQVNTLHVGDDGSYRFGYAGMGADGNYTTTTYLNYLGPDTDNSLSSAYGAAASLLSDFSTGGGDTVRNYDLSTIEGRNLLQSKGIQQLNQQIRAGCAAGVQSGSVSLSSGQAFSNIPYDALHSPVGGQVGGYGGQGNTYQNNGDSTDINIRNVAGAHSFFYHAVPDRPDGSSGRARSIIQNFTLSEPNPCTHP
jgi:RHS repeat-associated protein